MHINIKAQPLISSRDILLFTTLALLTSLCMSFIYNQLNVKAIGNYNNSELAAHALTYQGKQGVKACQDVGQPGDSQCKSFVNCVVYAVSGRGQWPAPGYHEGFSNAGGVEVSRSAVIRGDIVQTTTSLLHTAIVDHVYGDGSFEVVDANWNYDGVVKKHLWRPGTDARFWRMGKTSQTVKPIIGSLDGIRRAPGGIRAIGWAIDQDTPNPINVHLYSGDGEIKPTTNPGKELLANEHRSDIGSTYPAYGSKHGFNSIVAARNASHQRICAYGINAPGTPGAYAKLGCKDINVSPDPFGYLDSAVRVTGGVRVRGWTIDPDTASPIKVHVYGGTGAPSPTLNPGKAATASTSRSDVANQYPDYGDKHGYDVVLPISAASQKICVYAINNAPNSYNPQLGCKQV